MTTATGSGRGAAQGQQATPVVELREVSFGYGAEPTLIDVQLTVQRGEFLGLIGPNGSGKSTLLQIILGLLKPERGEVLLFGQPQAQFHDRWRIGYVPQRLALFDAHFPATVAEVVMMGRFARLGLLRRPGAADRAAVDRALEWTGAANLRQRRFGSLSVGQQQRVLIARALASDAELLILDEPTAAVDAATQEEFYDLLERLNRQSGLTLILVEHALAMVAAHVSTIALLNRRIVFQGTPDEYAARDFLHGIYSEQTTCAIHPEVPHLHHSPGSATGTWTTHTHGQPAVSEEQDH